MHCSAWSTINLHLVPLILAFRGHEAGITHAYWVIISCGFMLLKVFVTGFVRSPMPFILKPIFLLPLWSLKLFSTAKEPFNKDFSFFSFLRQNSWISKATCICLLCFDMHAFREQSRGLHTQLATVNHKRPFSDFSWGEGGLYTCYHCLTNQLFASANSPLANHDILFNLIQ